jgi:hypothetical protein
MRNKRFTSIKPKTAAGAALVLFLAGAGTKMMRAQTSTPATPVKNGSSKISSEARTMNTESKFYCNIKALNVAERAHHKQLTDKLIAARRETVETEKGYEFQFSPRELSLAELADWVAAEAKCCPFFDFHIDLEYEGALLCLRLTGKEGIKPFIQSEFQISAK